MLAPGTRLGPYEIVAALGAGGMGEVYRARDTRLGRDVAIKVLPDQPARETGFEERFSREARAVASLNHPNIVAIHDVGAESGAMYAVMELLEGQTLRQRLSQGLMSLRKTVELAAQVADALGAAHRRGVVHRDVKPENIFITSDGRAKVLDFGLVRHESDKPGGGDDLTTVRRTEPGTVMGTVGYMSPEQVRGEAVDHRSDVFALGCTLYEMLGGRGAFIRKTSADTLAAILREDPPPLADAHTPVPSALVGLVHRCLEKEPAERFQSMQDLAYALRTVTTTETSGTRSSVVPAPSRRMHWLKPAALLLAGTALGLLLHSLLVRSPAPLRFQKITFRQGTIFSARFAPPDGNSIVYGAAWSGQPVQLFSTRADGRESRELGIQADVLGISKSGEMALSLGRASLMTLLTTGRLARAPLSGGAPREILDGVVDADWSPDGSNLAVTREVDGEARLEYPIGRVRHRGPGYFSSPRISPDGAMVAFIEHPVKGDDRGGVSTVDESGAVKRLATDLSAVTGLAWSPDGSEIWFSATASADGNSIEAVTPNGARRLVSRLGVRAKLFDVLGSQALIGIERGQAGSAGLLRGDTIERDLSWLDGTAVMEISDTGDRILFAEGWEGGGPRYSFFVRRADEDVAVRLGEGVGAGLSPDGRSVIAYLPDPPARLSIVPIGPGETRTIDLTGFDAVFGAAWFPDGVRLLVWTNEPGKAVGAYVTDVKGTKPRPITGVGFTPPVWVGARAALSRDGQLLAATNAAGQIELFPVDGGERRTVPGIKTGEQMVAWLGDGSHLLVRERRGLPNRVFRVAIDSAQRELWREVMPLDPAGVLDVLGIVTTPDAKHYAYSYIRIETDLYLLEGLR